MKWQSQLFYCQFLLLPYLDVTPVSQQRSSPIRAGPLCTKRHTFWLMAFLVDRNQICVSKCHKQISEIFQKTMDIMVQFFSIKRRPFPMLALQSHQHLQDNRTDYVDLRNIKEALFFLAPLFHGSIQFEKDIWSVIAKTQRLLKESSPVAE